MQCNKKSDRKNKSDEKSKTDRKNKNDGKGKSAGKSKSDRKNKDKDTKKVQHLIYYIFKMWNRMQSTGMCA